jgi:peptide deformylase
MTIRPITIHGEPVLHRRASEVTQVDDGIRTLIEDMFETQDAARGVGLAAPQVGVGLRIFTWAFEDSGDAPSRGHVINPVLTRLGKTSQEDPDPDEESEGCLSVPGYSFPLKRSDHVRLTGQDVDGNEIDFEATGWFARVMQHEYDHLDGYLYINRLNGKWTRRWKKSLRREGWNVPGNTWLPGTDRDPFGHDDTDPAEADGHPQDA